MSIVQLDTYRMINIRMQISIRHNDLDITSMQKLTTGYDQAHRFLGAPGGGGGSSGTPNPVEPVVAPPPNRSELLAFGPLAFARPGIEMEKVCPSFNE